MEMLACLVVAGMGVLMVFALKGGPSSGQRAEANTLATLLRHVDQDLSRDTSSAVFGVIARHFDPAVRDEVQKRAGNDRESAG